MGVLFVATVVCGFCFGMGALVGYFHGLRHARRELRGGFPVLPLDDGSGGENAGDGRLESRRGAGTNASPRFPPTV
jgi:hypothetical protein